MKALCITVVICTFIICFFVSLLLGTIIHQMQPTVPLNLTVPQATDTPSYSL